MSSACQLGSARRARILQIGNYPPPACGWAVQTKLLAEEIRRRGYDCRVMNINENRKRKSDEYVDVQNGFDYLAKLVRFAAQGYRFQVHVNGQSRKGYLLALAAAAVGRLWARPVALSWRGGLCQRYFPRASSAWVGRAYRLLFRLSGQIVCNDARIKRAIQGYGIAAERIAAIPGFSAQNLEFEAVSLAPEIEAFLATHRPAFFCYVSFRPEYRLPVLRQAMRQFRRGHPRAGFIWVGFPSKEFPRVQAEVRAWPREEQDGVLLLANQPHDAFLTLLSRCSAYIRTPLCDGVASSVLESLALGIPVVASENHGRPSPVLTYREDDAGDLCEKLAFLTAHYDSVKQQASWEETDDNIARTADWLLGEPARDARKRNRSLAYGD